jgi:hypothetical protein
MCRHPFFILGSSCFTHMSDRRPESFNRFRNQPPHPTNEAPGSERRILIETLSGDNTAIGTRTKDFARCCWLQSHLAETVRAAPICRAENLLRIVKIPVAFCPSMRCRLTDFPRLTYSIGRKFNDTLHLL